MPGRSTINPVSELAAAVAGAAAVLVGEDGAGAKPTVERPNRPGFGDYSTNAAMMLAPALGAPPREIAERLGDELRDRLGDSLAQVEVAGPGFINLTMSDAWCCRGVAAILEAGERYGSGAGGEHVNVEFVSANPTGPLTVAAGRHAAYGDALCRILQLAGHEVEREYYVNDTGGQVERFAASIAARARGEEPPSDGYQGAYVADIAAAIDGAATVGEDELGRAGVEAMMAAVAGTLERFRVTMDSFSHESAAHSGGALERALDRLAEHGETYVREGATWLRSTSYGDDKDRVLVRSNGETTYFASDIAYHEDKLSRAYDRVIDVLGADHHGYLARMQAAWVALGGAPGRFEIVIMQLVNLLEAGQRAQMSKRGGEFVTLDELMDDIGVDATRWFLLQRSHDTALDLDLALARRRSQDNPVFYAQYAHARIASILRKAGHERVDAALDADVGASDEQLHPSARELVKRLLELPEEVEDAAERRAPHRITTYATEAAQSFSAFYRDCKVVGAAEEGGDEDLRLAMCEATRRVIARSLDLLGVRAPEEM